MYLKEQFDFSDSTAQVGNNSIEVWFTEKKQDYAKDLFTNVTPAPDSTLLHKLQQCDERIEGTSDKKSQEVKSALKVDEFHDYQESASTNGITESSLSSDTA